MSLWSFTRSLFGAAGVQRIGGPQVMGPGSYTKQPAAPVTFDSAMSISAFWASARLLSETVAALPMTCRRKSGDVFKPFEGDPLWRLLAYQPNRYQTRVEFFETLMLNLVTTGNSFHAIQRDESDQIVGLLPLMSAQMQVTLLEDGARSFRYYTETGDVRVYAEENIWHVKLFGNGVLGLSPLGYARQSLGVAIAADNRTSSLAKNGGKSSGILMVDKVLTPEQRKAVRAEFHRLTEGPNDELFVLEANMKFQPTSLSPVDQQLLETRRFQIEDIARFMGVPSVLINDTAGSTTWGSGIGELVQGFHKLNLRPYLERIEASIERHLLPSDQWGRTRIEFDFDALLRADFATRMEAWQKGINAGLFMPNEGREAEGRAPAAGGDRLYLNGNMVPASMAGAPKLPRQEGNS